MTNIIDVEFRELRTSRCENKPQSNRKQKSYNKLNDTLILVSIILGETVLAIYAKNIFIYLTYR